MKFTFEICVGTLRYTNYYIMVFLSAVKPCTDDELRCQNGKCVNKAWRCDNVDDCRDGTDEPRQQCCELY